MARVVLGAFGDPGHAFPMLALGRALVRGGHDVWLQTWNKWAEHAEEEGIRFAAAPEYHVFPTRERPLKPYEAVVRAAAESQAILDEARPDAVVADILTLAPALAAERAGVPIATHIPHVDPRFERGWPAYSIGARPARTPLGRAMWAQFDRVVVGGLEKGREELNETRRRLDLPPLDRVHGGISEQLCLVGTFPQLEYPRRRRLPGVHVTGPLLWEPPFGDVELPPGDDPLVLIAPSTSQDQSHRLLRAALEGCADLPVRVLGTWNRREPEEPLVVPPNARVVDWVSYSRTMPLCDYVICHAGHGTVARALQNGCPVIAVPAAGDQNENAARLEWAGLAGVRLPRRYVTPRSVRLAVGRALARPELRERAQAIARWSADHDGAERAAELVVEFARSGAVATAS